MTYTDEAAMAEIRRIVATEIGTLREVKTTDRLVQELGLDSMTLITLAVALEDHFRILLSDEAAMRIETVGELARCVAERANAAHGIKEAS